MFHGQHASHWVGCAVYGVGIIDPTLRACSYLQTNRVGWSRKKIQSVPCGDLAPSPLPSHLHHQRRCMRPAQHSPHPHRYCAIPARRVGIVLSLRAGDHARLHAAPCIPSEANPLRGHRLQQAQGKGVWADMSKGGLACDNDIDDREGRATSANNIRLYRAQPPLRRRWTDRDLTDCLVCMPDRPSWHQRSAAENF